MLKSLEDLLAPITLTEFVEGYWEQQPLLLINRSPERYAWFDLCLEKLDEVILSASVVKDTLQIGRVLPNGSNIQQFVQQGPAFWPTATEAYRTGHTLAIFTLEKFIPRLWPFLSCVERELSCGVSCSLYASLAKAEAGFRPHYDHDDVYILQLEGSKRWRVWRPVEELPLNAAQLEGEAVAALGLPVLDIWLQPGDLLYVPHGWIHQVSTGEKASLHLSLIPDPCQWQDLIVDAILQATTRTLACRRSLLPGFLQSERSKMKGEFVENLEQALKVIDFEEALGRVSRNVVRGMIVQSDGYFTRLEKQKQKQITMATVLRKCYGSASSLSYSSNKEQLILTLPNNELEIPAYAEKALREIISKETFRPQDLPIDYPNEVILRFCEDLIAAGFLIEASQPTMEP